MKNHHSGKNQPESRVWWLEECKVEKWKLHRPGWWLVPLYRYLSEAALLSWAPCSSVQCQGRSMPPSSVKTPARTIRKPHTNIFTTHLYTSYACTTWILFSNFGVNDGSWPFTATLFIYCSSSGFLNLWWTNKHSLQLINWFVSGQRNEEVREQRSKYGHCGTD